MRLADASWPEIGENPLVLVPVGSVEQHGPHLPMDTDTTIAVAVAERTATRLGVQVVVAPPVVYGSSGEHQSFPGTTSIGTSVLLDLLVEMVRSMHTWAGRVVLVNAHGGNLTAIVGAVRLLLDEQHDVAWIPCATEAVDLHAGVTETSLMLHLRPDSVRVDRAEAGDTRSLAEILPAMVTGGVAAVSPNGVLGDPAGASADRGAELLDAMVTDTVAALVEGALDARGRLVAPIPVG